ncbi:MULTISPECIES: SMI1/KNR4 family protein [Streptomyces]|uniref:SMI1/KNR4 family protein n=1 Tax=Streptomyces TaxID=1883 RepID=UPI0014882ED5|nr:MULTISPECIES: SMI1/KNR4 family protein [Streptomyces]
MAMLGPAQNRYAQPSAWSASTPISADGLPPDYRVIVDAYAPIQLNGHLYLSHLATERWNLAQWIRDTIHAWSEVPWDELDLDADEDPRRLFGLEELSFGTRNGLWPIACTDRGETIFLDAAADATRLVVNYGETWAEHRLSFTEWLHRYLIGEDMTGPNSSAFYPGPVKLQHLPMSAGEHHPEPWYGPDRGMCGAGTHRQGQPQTR